MKKIATLFIFVFIYQTALSQVWESLNGLTSNPRNRAGSFAIGGKGYVVAGGSSWYLTDAWSYDTLANSWSQIADFPADDDDGCVGFAINGIGYMGTGAYCCYQYGNEFYSYNPGNNTWTQMADFPGQGRSFAVSFELDGKGYIGGGLNGYNNNPLADFYCYDPGTNTWSQIADCPASGVSLRAVSFVVNGKAYVGTGGQQQGAGSSTFAPTSDFWEYDTTSKAWTQVADFGGGPRWLATSFATCDKGFVGTGVSDANQSVYTNDMWQYDPIKNTWTQIASYGGIPRESASSFVIGQTAYVGFGYDGSGVDGDLWKFTPLYTPAFSAVTSTCAGTVVTFTDTSNYGPTNWQWNFPGGTPSSSTSQNPVIKYNSTGTYDVILTAWNGCDSATKTFSKYITISPALNVSISPVAPVVCNGQTITLKATGGTTYQWVGTSNTTDSLNINPTRDTTYELIISNGSCNIDTLITVKAGNPPPLDIEPQGYGLCLGSSVNLYINGGGSNFSWSPSTGLNGTTGDTVTANPTATVTYTVTGIDNVGCTSSGTNVLAVVPAPNKPTISVEGDTLISSATQGNQWYYNNNIINGATNQILLFNGQNGGSYKVEVINPANGCSSISDSTTAINQLSTISQQFSIYPNPTTGTIYININSTVQDMNDWNLQVSDVLGRILIVKSSLNSSNEIDLSYFSGGVYFVTIANKAGRAVFPVVKQN